MAHDAPQHVVKILPGVDSACFAGLDKPKEKCSGPGSSLTGCKQPVLPAQSQRPDGVFRLVIIRPQSPVLKVAKKAGADVAIRLLPN